MKRTFLWTCLLLAALCGQFALSPAQADAPPFALVKDINTAPQPSSGIPPTMLFTTLNNTMLFSGFTPQTGKELWASDGTEAGTHLIKDINPGADPGLAYYGTPSLVLNNRLLFDADDGARGIELWASDGTEAGTILLKDTRPGKDSGYAYSFTTAGDRAFFVAQISEQQMGLWITDGTPGGTTLLRAFASISTPMVVMGSTLLFNAADSGNDAELWRSDGTPGGTTLVKDIMPGATGSAIRNLIVRNAGQVLFSANDGTHGIELWKTDGTPGGTALVKDIRPGGSGSDPDSLVLLSSSITIFGSEHILFSADDGTHGDELWITDGTDAGTQLLKDVNPNAGSANPLPRGLAGWRLPRDRARAFFAMDDGTHGRELWITDATYTGTVMLADVFPGSSGSDPGDVVGAGGSFFFAASSPTTGQELWRTDGTPQGTMQVADINAGMQNSDPESMAAFNNKLFFTADDGVHGRELWSSDGTTTAMLKDIWPGKPNGVWKVLGVALGELYFAANDGATGIELWKTDGTPQGTVQVRNIAPDTSGISLYNDDNQAALGDKLIMGLATGMKNSPNATQHAAAEASMRGAESPARRPATDDRHASIPSRVDDSPPPASVGLWQSDGTVSGTTLIQSFPNLDVVPEDLTTLNNGVLFGASDTIGVTELWRTDGTPAGTSTLTNVVKPYFGYVHDFTRLNNLVVFGVYTGTLPMQNSDFASLWKTDGTPQGTRMITANVVYDTSSRAVSGSTIFFSGSTADKQNDVELWKTDGTPQGTALLKDIASGSAGSYPDAITPGQPGVVFFIAYTAMTGYQLWKSDGTAAGTVMVHDVRPGSNISEYGNLAYMNHTLFFEANDGVHGGELWKSDGTDAGTVMLADLYPGAGSSDPQGLVALNGVLYFSATGPDGRRTLWRSDGTPQGTQPVRSDAGAPLDPYNLTLVQGQLMFSAADAAHGREVWRSDGSAAGTVLAQDIVPGADSGNPESFIQAGQHVFFTADTPGVGRELWATAPARTPPPDQPTPTPPAQTPSGQRVYLPLLGR